MKKNLHNSVLQLFTMLFLLTLSLGQQAAFGQTCTAPNQCNPTAGFPNAPASAPGATAVITETFDGGFGIFTEDTPPGPGTTGANDLTVSTAGDTPSAGTGPETTPGCNGGSNDGEFIFLEGSSTQSTETHCMTTNIPLPAAGGSVATPFALSFWYHMFGDNIGTLEVFVNGTSEFAVTGQQQTANCQPWLQGDIDVSALAGTTIAVQVCMSEGNGAVSTFESDISFDHFQVFATVVPCEITCPADIVVNNDAGICGAQVNFIGQAGAACSADPVTNDFTGDASTSAVFPVGTTTVTLTATDNFGNPVSCSFDVTVIDTEAPQFTSCPTSQTINLGSGDCGATVNYVVEALDNCSVGPGGSLTTLFARNNGASGNMFDIENLSGLPMTITGLFEVNLATNATTDVSVYFTTTASTYVGNETNAGEWTLLGTAAGVTSAGLNNPTPIDVGNSFILLPGQSVGLFVSDNTSDIDYTNSPTPTVFDDGTLQITTGVGRGVNAANPFAGGTFAGRAWNGSIEYTTGFPTADVIQTSGLPSGSTFPVGTTTNTFTTTDAAGNTNTCTFDITVNEFAGASGQITVNPVVQTSLDPSGACTFVTSDEILEGSIYGCFDNYILTRTPAVAAGFGCPTGPTYFGGVPVTCADIGRPVQITITDPNTGNSQWATIIVEDKTDPILEGCEDLTVGCNFDPNFVGVVTGGVRVAEIGAQPTLPNGADEDYFTTLGGIPSSATITNVEVFVDATATDINDFIIRLIHPDGTTVDLFAIVGGGNAATCQGSVDFDVTFSDAGPATPICVGGTGPRGLLAPAEPLSALIGLPAAGEYTLQIENTFATDMFTLNSAEIRVTTGDINFGPTVSDNCPGVTVSTIISGDNADCGGNGTIIRTFIATDASGNTATCEQTITVELPELSDIEFPENLDGISGPMLECTSGYPSIGSRVSVTETRTFTPGTAIVNGGSIQIPVSMTGFPGDAQIEDLDISLDISYGTAGDLIIDYGRQFDPNPTSLLANVCGGGNDILATLDDSGFAQYDCATFDPALKGTFQPNGSLADFNGQNPNGTFILYVEDFDGTNFDFGSVDEISFSVTYSTATLITAPTIGGMPFDQLDCQINMVSEDTVLPGCSANSYKVRRKFTVINMCTGEDIVVNQIIAVADQDAPIVACPRSELDNPITLVALSNQSYQNSQSQYGTCLGDITVPPVTVLSDNCSGVGSITTELYNADGTQVGSVAGNGGTFFELPLDDGIFTSATDEPSIRYTVRYVVEDNCNNQEVVEVFYNVVERTAPVADCDEITNVSLTTTDTTFVDASVFDDGSYDICSDIHFYVRRMQPTNDQVAYGNYFESIRLKQFVPFKFRERVAFTCDDTNVMVYFLVVDDFVQGYIDFFVDVFIPSLPAAVRNNPNTPYTIWPDGTFYLSTFPGIGGETKDIWQGHYNICMVDVEVEDKVAPIKLLDNPDRTIVCTDAALRQQYVDDTNVTFDAPVFSDNCDFTVSLTVIDGTTTCGDGIIRRRFQATDANGNMSILCEQRITSVLEHDYTILWPRDEDRNMCTSGVLGDTLSRPNSLIEDACDLLAVSYTDQRFATNDDACYKILRTYDVINWCEWDGFSTPVQIGNPTFTTAGPRLDVVVSAAGAQDVQLNFNPTNIVSVGRWSYIQHIKVYDEEDPTLGTITQAPCAAANVVDDVAGFGCGQSVSVDFELTDNCGGLTPPTYRLVAFTGDVDGDGTISAAELAAGVSFPNDPFAGSLSAPAGSTSSVAQSGTFNISGTYPLGDHVFVVTARDLCGNEAEYYVPFTAEDCKPPTPKALSFITIDLMATGMVSCVAPHVDNGSFDGCGPVKLSFSANVNDTVRTFTCTDLGTNPVQLWVTDAAGNQDFVDVDIIIQDNLGACTGTAPRIASSLTTAGGTGVEGAAVNVSGDATMSATTDVNGVTGFDVTSGGDYTVSALLDSDPANGVSTYDLYLIGQHILGVTDLTTFSELTAADANANGSVSAFDMTVIRRVILGLDQNFRGNTSWRFFNANDNSSEVVSINDIQSNVAADFLAVKTGDVNGNAQANSRQALAPRTLVGEFALVADDAVLAAGETKVVSFEASEVALGYQLTLEWDATALEVVSVNGAAHNAADFGKHLLSEGKLTMSHNGSMEGELFSLEVRALRDGVALSEVMTAGSSVTTAEAYSAGGEKSVVVRFGGSVAGAGNALEQNRPNPFAGSTQIGFTLAEAGAATLTVTDVTGRVVYRVAGQFDAGRSQVEIAAGELPSAGLLNYTLTAGDFTATRKMVVIK